MGEPDQVSIGKTALPHKESIKTRRQLSDRSPQFMHR